MSELCTSNHSYRRNSRKRITEGHLGAAKRLDLRGRGLLAGHGTANEILGTQTDLSSRPERSVVEGPAVSSYLPVICYAQRERGEIQASVGQLQRVGEVRTRNSLASLGPHPRPLHR